MSCCGDDDSEGSIEVNSDLQGLPLNHVVREQAVDPGLYAGDCQATCITTPAGDCPTLVGAPCAPAVGVSCGSPGVCNRPRCGCGCTPAARQTCKPYYQSVPVCPEDNKQVIIRQTVTSVLVTAQASAVPACGQSVKIVFQYPSVVAVGAYLWAYGLGKLKIVGFNTATKEIELENTCEVDCQDQAAPGTPIPNCTVFVLTPPSCPSATSGSNNTYPYLNSGFVAPANGTCIDVAVTNVNGLSVGKNVAINTGTYRISQIKSPQLITICNDGAGLTPGTVVNYQDGAGNLIVPIVLIDSNPCLNTSVTTSIPLSCNNNVVTPLVGTGPDQVLAWNDTTGKAQFKNLGIPVLDCTELTACLTLDPALPGDTAYIVNVLSTAAYSPGQLVVIGITQFTVSVILNATQMRIIPVDAPIAIQTFAPGSTLCAAGCCEELSTQLEQIVVDNTDPFCSGQFLVGYGPPAVLSTDIGPTIISTGSPLASGNLITTTFSNPSCSRQVKGLIIFGFTWIFDQTAANGEVGCLQVKGYGGHALTTPPVPGLIAELPNCYIFHTDAGVNRHSVSVNVAVPFNNVPPGGVLGISARADLLWTGGTVGNTFTTVSQLARISYTGFAVDI